MHRIELASRHWLLFTECHFPPFSARWPVSGDSVLVIAATRDGAKTHLVQFGGENGKNGEIIEMNELFLPWWI